MSEQPCTSTWHGYTCGQTGEHTNHIAFHNGRTAAMWSDAVADKRDDDGEQE